MKNDLAIKVENLSKKYQIGKQEKYLTLRDQITEIPKKIFSQKRNNEFWALKDISFGVRKGEVLGVIGPNGAGKSTLLKILSRITEPTKGKAIWEGRVASMLEVGTGFHQELTGRENIFLNGAILGMTRREIQEKFADIVEFSGIEKFIDTPVKRYSSGMYVRLAFSIAAHLDSDILLVDEVLAVGDAEFQKKSLGKMNELTEKSSRTIIFVSHNMQSIRSLCQKCIWLKEGKVHMMGGANDVVSKYIQFSVRNLESTGPFKTNNPNIKIDTIKLNKHKNIQFNDDLIFEINLSSKEKINNLLIGIQVLNSTQARIMTGKVEVPSVSEGTNTITISIEKPRLPPGNYSINIGMGRGGAGFFYRESILRFKIISTNMNDSFAVSRGDRLGAYPKTNYRLNDE